ncbi:MAG: DNA helicase UvrD [Candidatus Omnitrophica bacterium]|nr:DNA helicase UvrD [Candidatus Omnitrophota bacterium]
MKFYADLHIHSHYSRATSKDLDLEHLFYWAQLKGIQVVGTGDFVHPSWLAELKEKLEPAEEGLFRLKPARARPMEEKILPRCRGEVRFMLTVEISSIYKKLGKVRKVHNVVFVPSFAAAEKLQSRLETIGNIRSDGRPILGLDSRDLLEIVLETDPLACLIPAHIWTPWFSALGSSSGFDRVSDCFADLTKHIFAVETGLSSDPLMNWRLKQLDPFVLVSNSDAHSPAKLGREATIYDTGLSYPAIYRALSDPKDKGLAGTIEFFPEEGKYHYDGHRACKTRLHPRETRKRQGLCPVCGKPVTVGVMARVEELADRPEGEKSARWRPYHNLIPLPEIIAEAKGLAGPGSKSVQQLYVKILSQLGNELFVLREAPLEQIEAAAGDLVAEGVRRVREGKVEIAAGYDGEYGKVHIFSGEDHLRKEGQLTIFP